MNKKYLIGAVAGGVLVGTAFAAQLSLGGLGKSLGNATYQIGYLVGSLIALSAIVIPSMSLGKDQGGSPTTFLSQDTLKYIIPALFIASAAGTFFGTGTDYGSVATQAIADGMFHWMWIGFGIQMLRSITGEVGGGILKGIGSGYEKKMKDKIRGKDIPEDYRAAHDFKEALENYRTWGGQTGMDVGRLHVGGGYGFGDDIRFLQQARVVV